jgi:hypothetical protein
MCHFDPQILPYTHVLKPLHVAAADVAFVGGDAADVVGVGPSRGRPHKVGVQVVEGGAHFGGVFLVHAEDDGLGEAVGLFQEIGEVRATAWVRARRATRRSKSAVV